MLCWRLLRPVKLALPWSQFNYDNETKVILLLFAVWGLFTNDNRVARLQRKLEHMEISHDVSKNVQCEAKDSGEA